MGNQAIAAKKLKLAKQYAHRPYANFDPVDIPLKSRRNRGMFIKPTAEMLALARQAVTAGKVRKIPATNKRLPSVIDPNRQVLAHQWGERGFSV